MLFRSSGKLLSPDIAFDVNLPTLDASTAQRVKDLISESEMNQQIFSLLVLHTFLPPRQYQALSGENSKSNYGSVTSSELLSNQLSNWLSQISNDFDIGVHYRPGDEITSNEVELALSTQLFNDKLSIDGTVANKSSAQNANAIVGDVNAEYKLTNDGKLKIKEIGRARVGKECRL